MLHLLAKGGTATGILKARICSALRLYLYFNEAMLGFPPGVGIVPPRNARFCTELGL